MAIRDLSLPVPLSPAAGGNGDGPGNPSDLSGPPEVCPVFFSYSHFDLKWVKQALKQFRVLERLGHIELFQDQSDINLGDLWLRRVKDAIDNSAIAICFLSPDYLDSEFCVEHEVPHLQRQMEAGKLRIIPVLLKDCLWDIHPLWSKLQIFTDEDEGPLVNGNNSQHRVERNLIRLAREIQKLVTDPEPPEPTAPGASFGERRRDAGGGKGWWQRPGRPRGPRGESACTLALHVGTGASFAVVYLDGSGSMEAAPGDRSAWSPVPDTVSGPAPGAHVSEPAAGGVLHLYFGDARHQGAAGGGDTCNRLIERAELALAMKLVGYDIVYEVNNELVAPEVKEPVASLREVRPRSAHFVPEREEHPCGRDRLDFSAILIDLIDHGRPILGHPAADHLLRLRLLGDNNCATDDAVYEPGDTLPFLPLHRKIPILSAGTAEVRPGREDGLT